MATLFLLLLMMLMAVSPASALDAEEEFLGPFSTWTNIKNAPYNAVGNGIANDTAAIQAAFTALGTGGIHTLYFPAGTYLVSTRLDLINKIGVSIIGQDPATTILKWVGSAGVDAMWLNGFRYSRIERFTFNGNNLTRAFVDQDWDNVTPNFDTAVEYLDIIWQNSTHGLWCGSSNFGCAETTLKRNLFQNISQNCVQLWNFNAIDMWVWDSTFTACGRAVTNQLGAGSFRVYRSLFQNSTIADMEIANTQVFSVRDNFSIGSDRFWKGTSSGNPAPVVLQGNTIIDSVQNDTIQVANHGPLLLFDNTIRIKSGGSAPLVTHIQASNTDTVSLSNTYSVASAITATGRLFTDGDTVVDRTTISSTLPIMPNAAISMGRTPCSGCDVAAGSSTATVQAAINSAVAAGNKAIVHLQAGLTTINATLTIPANADIQITGDGYQQSVLSWSGSASTPMFTITGPTKVRLQDIELHAQDSADGILMTNIDQVGARIALIQLQLRQGFGSHLLVSNLNQAKVEWINSNSGNMTAGTATQIIGGTVPTIFWSGSSGTNINQYTVREGGTLVVRDMYYETGVSPSFASFADRGTVVFDSLRIALPNTATPGITLTNWQGSATFLGSILTTSFALNGSGASTQFLGLGMQGVFVNPYVLDSTAPPASTVLMNSRYGPGTSSTPATDIGTAVPSTIQSQTALTRSLHPQRMTDTANGVSDIRLQRVWIHHARHALTITNTPTASPPLRLLR